MPPLKSGNMPANNFSFGGGLFGLPSNPPANQGLFGNPNNINNNPFANNPPLFGLPPNAQRPKKVRRNQPPQA